MTHFLGWFVSLIKESLKSGEDSAGSESALISLASIGDNSTATGHRLQPPLPPEVQPQMEMASSSDKPATGVTQFQLDAKLAPPKVCVCLCVYIYIYIYTNPKNSQKLCEKSV